MHEGEIGNSLDCFTRHRQANVAGARRFRARSFVHRVEHASGRDGCVKRSGMAKRMLAMLAVTALLVGGLGFVKFRQIQTAIGQAAAFQPPPEAVTTIVAVAGQWPATLNAIGTMAAVQGVTVSADLPGTAGSIGVESGQLGRGGEVLALLDPPPGQAPLAPAG